MLNRLCVLTLALFAASLAAAGASLTFPIGTVPFSSIYAVTGPNANGDYLVEGRVTTLAENGFLIGYLLSLPASAGGQAYSNQSIELAPGMFFSNVLVPTQAEIYGNFEDDGGLPIIDPYTGLPYPGNTIPTSQLFDGFAFLVGASSTVAPEPSAALLIGIGLSAILLQRRRR